MSIGLLLACALAAQVPAAQAPTAQARTAHAVRVDQALRIDGRLLEPVWRSAPAISGLTQREPDEGAPAPENTEVRIAYDDDALYIGARMFSRDPTKIHALVTRRDNAGSSEQLVISLDTYRDRRTAYSFAVTPAGVRLDYYHNSDSEGSTDRDYNPVWEASARVDAEGWVAEMRIPFAQLRFSPADAQEWGINVVRGGPVSPRLRARAVRRKTVGSFVYQRDYD